MDVSVRMSFHDRRGEERRVVGNWVGFGLGGNYIDAIWCQAEEVRREREKEKEKVKERERVILLGSGPHMHVSLTR